MSSIAIITKHEEFLELISQEHCTVIKFFQAHCPACISFNPVFERAAVYDRFTKVAKFYKIDCSTGEHDHAMQLASVTTVPRIAVFRKGKFIKSLRGYQPWEQLEEFLSVYVLESETQIVSYDGTPTPLQIHPESMKKSNSIGPSNLESIGFYSYKDGNISSTTLTSCSSSNTIIPPFTSCIGDYLDRPFTVKDRLRGFVNQDKRFDDPEFSCVLDMNMLQIGRANHRQSFFSIVLIRPEDESQANTIKLRLEFCAIATEGVRFSSAYLKMEFRHHLDNSSPMRTHPAESLTIAAISPQDDNGNPERVHWKRGGDMGLKLGLSYGPLSVAEVEGKYHHHADYTRESYSWVRGYGLGTSKATWAFKEDDSPAGRHGLNPHYDLSVTLPQATNQQMIRMGFWGKAILSKGKKEHVAGTLIIGSQTKPWVRLLSPWSNKKMEETEFGTISRSDWNGSTPTLAIPESPQSSKLQRRSRGYTVSARPPISPE
ncbi:hypothetical protein QCA50_010835 [Cerrena zonata]|uniref:Thioredoxin domain-containing protein n=1 Tax=Cerrena zonata TaxID=2478898 RepID=A0AAW0G2W3_9APHY